MNVISLFAAHLLNATADSEPEIDLADIDIAVQLQEILFAMAPILVKIPTAKQKRRADDRQQQFQQQFLFHGLLRTGLSISGCRIKSS